MIGWLRRMFARHPDPRVEDEMRAARREHRAALEATQHSNEYVRRVIAERHHVDAMMKEADASMFGDRLER